MLTVVTHLPSPALQECELTFLDSETINIEKARKEHDQYCSMLSECGAQVIKLEDNLSLPDSVFVEDPVIVFDEVAVLTSMGVESRRKELPVLQKFFAQHRHIERISLPAQIEGGDVLKIGRKIFVGNSQRTNEKGITALRNIIEPLGYTVIPVKVTGCLHLKTGCTALDDSTILLNPDWVESRQFSGYNLIKTLPEEPFGANVLPIKDTICMNAAFPQTIEMVKSLGYTVAETDITEFVKAEAGLTCMSVPFYQNPPGLTSK
jgi:dimethylargininase